MIEVKSRTHINRIFAERTFLGDLFRVVIYFSYHGNLSKVPWWYSKHKGNSCFTDLTKSMDEIMAGMKSNTRNEIRRAVKEGCNFEIVDGFDEFISLYNAFCKSKGLADFTSEARMRKFGKILVTKAVHNGTTMAMHTNILDEVGKVALLQFSCSPRLDENVDRKMIGWANRFLHYKDLEWLRENGYKTYDWSGVVVDPDDPRHSIGEFKLSFGGTLCDSWTLRSPLYILAEKARGMLFKACNFLQCKGC